MSDAPDAVKSGKVKVTVPMLNVVQLLLDQIKLAVGDQFFGAKVQLPTPDSCLMHACAQDR